MTKFNAVQVGNEVVKGILPRVAAAVKNLLNVQARRRIQEGGDSQHRYPDLWDHPKSFRRGGQAFNTTGLEQSINSEATIDGDVVKMRLRGREDALYHQTGFTTSGPNFIPLTLRAKRDYTVFKRIVGKLKPLRGKHDAATRQRRAEIKEEMEAAGFIMGETYIMAWRGVDVPQRKIFNLPPENVEEINESLALALR